MKRLFEVKEGDQVWENTMYPEDLDWVVDDRVWTVLKVQVSQELNPSSKTRECIYIIYLRDHRGYEEIYRAHEDHGIFHIGKNRNLFFDTESLEEYKVGLLKASIHEYEHKRIDLDTLLSNTIEELKTHFKHE